MDKYEQGVEINITKYICIIGFSLYLTASRSDIIFSVFMCARFQASPRESHFKIVKIILRCLNRTSHHCLWFLKGNQFRLIGFSDSVLLYVSQIGKVLVILVIHLDIIYFLSTVRRTIMFLFLQLRINM